VPVRSLTSSVLKWPDRQSVEAAVREWAETVIEKTSTVTRVGYGGSLAGEEWGFGSDVDLILILSSSSSPFFERGRQFDATLLPVPADLFVYTEREWDRVANRWQAGGRVEWVSRRDARRLEPVDDETDGKQR
jgi:uncharacterized protein